MNCKIGDLAIIVGTRGISAITPGIVGRVVEILRPHVPQSDYRSIAGDVMSTNTIGSSLNWVVRSSHPLPWAVLKGPHAGEVWLFDERCILDTSLRPISGVPVHDEVTEEVSA